MKHFTEFYLLIPDNFQDFNEDGYIEKDSDSEIICFPNKDKAIEFLNDHYRDLIVERDDIPVSMSFSGEFAEKQPYEVQNSPKYIYIKNKIILDDKVFSYHFERFHPEDDSSIFIPKFIFEPLLTAHEMYGNPLFE